MKSQNNIKEWQLGRYLVFIKYISFVKTFNLIHSLLCWLVNKVEIKTKPAILRVEISRKCEVNCLYCTEKKEDIFYPLDLYKKVIDELKEYLFLVSLYEIGEPLENKSIVEYIKYARSQKIGTIISTNLSVIRSDEFWRELVLSGLDRIIVSIDGISPEVYNIYRRKGDLILVLSNLEKILFYKRQLRSGLIIEWQMINFPWNVSEQKTAREYAKEIGCNSFRIIEEVTQVRTGYINSGYKRQKNCVLPYFTFNITAYNKVRSCTRIYNESMVIGDLNLNTLSEIWNGSEIRNIRSQSLIQSRAGCKTCCE